LETAYVKTYPALHEGVKKTAEVTGASANKGWKLSRQESLNIRTRETVDERLTEFG
jgi:hypothetical protein